MDEDSSNVNVLYAKVVFEDDKNNLLQKLSEQLVKYFIEKGMLMLYYYTLKCCNFRCRIFGFISLGERGARSYILSDAIYTQLRTLS